MADDWRRHLLTTPAEVRALLQGISRVAVLGMRPASQSHKPAFYVPQALQDMGLTIVPVVVHDHPDTEILGEPVYRRLADVPGQLDLVDVFRRSEDIPAHVDDIIARRPAGSVVSVGDSQRRGRRATGESRDPGGPGPLPDGGFPGNCAPLTS